MNADAPTRLLLHGFTGGAADWDDCASTGDLAPDLPGHGAAPAPVGGFTETVAALLAGLPTCIEQVVGYSLGGRVALGLLAAAPQRFRHATIISAHPGLSDPTARAARRAADARWCELLRCESIVAFADAWQAQPLFASQSALPAERLQRQRQRRLSQHPQRLAAALECFSLAGMPSYWETLARYPGTLRWIVGARDAKFLTLAQRLRTLRPATELIELPGVGHNPLLEAPEQLRTILADSAQSYG